MSDTLFTLPAACRHQEEIKKSRFLAQAVPVESAEQALAALAQVSDQAATHNCWAWRMGQDYRFNDDGEPGGTAGRPILQAIEGQSMDRVLVVVTRWYGGIKLGAGGLSRAYGGTAAECLRIVERVPIVAMSRLATHCEFAELALLKARLKDLQTEVQDESFGADGVDLVLYLPDTQVADVALLVRDVTRGRSIVRQLDPVAQK